MTIVNGEWGDYMRANKSINDLVIAIIDNDLPTRKESGTFHMKIFAETGVNDRRTGYGMLNGTQNFGILMNVTVINEKELFYSAILQWNDRMDPSARQGDSPWVTGAKLFGYDPKDYNISITWMQSFNATRY